MKTNNRIFWIALALFSFTLSSLVASSFAWFKVADTLIASNIAIDFKKNEDFSVGLKKNGETTYFTSLDNTTLKEYFPSYDPTAGLLDVSSMYQSQWLNSSTVFEDTKPQLRIGYSAGANPNLTSVALSGYLQFEMFLHSERNMYVFLSEDTTLVADETANQKVADIYGYDVKALNKVQDCIRVSLYTESAFYIYEPNVTTSSKTPLAGRLNTTAPVSSYYDLDSNKNEILYGEYNYADPNLSLKYDEASRAAVPAADQVTGFTSGTNPLANGGLDIDKSISEGNLSIAQEKTYTLSELSKVDEKAYPLVYVPANVDKRIIVTIYVEGWDRDVVNSVEAGVFNLKLAFKGYYKSK